MRKSILLFTTMALLILGACDTTSEPRSDVANSQDIGVTFPDLQTTEDTIHSPEQPEGYYRACSCEEGEPGYQQFTEDHAPAGICLCGALNERELPDLSGRWAQYMVQTSSIKMPIFGDISDTEVRSLLLVNIEQEGIILSLTVTTCAIEMFSPDAIVETIMPDVFVASLETATRPGLLIPRQGKASFHLPPFYELRGVKLENPEEDPLPTDPEAPSVIDQDNDGFPGMTIRLTGALSGDLYIVQKSWSQMQSVEISEDRVTGHVVWEEQQEHLGSTNEVLRSVAVESWVKEDPSAHTFHMVRAPNATCETIVQNGATWFGP